MVVSPEPGIKRAESVPPSRTLAYQDKIVRADDAPSEAGSQKQAAPPPSAPAQATQAPAASEAGPNTAEQDSTDMAALPPDEGAAGDPNALPWQRAAPNPATGPGMDEEAPDPMAQPGEYDDPSDPMAGLPEDADPNAWPGGPEEEPQEWVQVLVSGAGMHGTASEDAPMLFAFPYGRTLRVVSRYEGWVEVTDPRSAATGWMQAHFLAPVAAPGTPQDAEAMYEEEEEPRWRGRWWRRNGGAFTDMINRALGGR